MRNVLFALVMCTLFANGSAWAATGTAALQWDANTEGDLSGYRLYRGLFPCPTSGSLSGPARADVGNATSTTDTMTLGPAPTQVCYGVTAYDLAGNESVMSALVDHTFPAGPPVPVGLPVDLQGTVLPEEATLPVTLVKPANVSTATVRLSVFDMDNPDEGELYINGNGPIALFGAQHLPNNDSTVEIFTVQVDPNWLLDGANQFRFTHTATVGYRIDDVSVDFVIADPPPAAPKGLRVVGTTVAADGTVTEIKIEVARLDCPGGVGTSTVGTNVGTFKRTVQCKPVIR